MTKGIHPIVGTWKLKSFTELDIGTNATWHPMGRNARATVIYTSNGHVATIFAAEARNAATTIPIAAIEAAHLFRTMVAFAGRYETKGSELIYYPEISWNEAWNGTTQVRHFEIKDDVLSIRSVPAKTVLGDAMTIMSMTWERA